jgi:hypothetical protein
MSPILDDTAILWLGHLRTGRTTAERVRSYLADGWGPPKTLASVRQALNVFEAEQTARVPHD